VRSSLRKVLNRVQRPPDLSDAEAPRLVRLRGFSATSSSAVARTLFRFVLANGILPCTNGGTAMPQSTGVLRAQRVVEAHYYQHRDGGKWLFLQRSLVGMPASAGLAHCDGFRI